MAAVFLGERVGADFDQQVAISSPRRGLDSDLEQRLFQRERQVLAALDHPNIAHLIDGGVTAAGIPYLVMEHVDGVPITVHALAHRLDVRRQLKLFLRVCRAVEAAAARPRLAPAPKSPREPHHFWTPRH
jgi:serine/threonine-protein kinase